MKTEILGAEHNIAHVAPDEPIADAGTALDAAMSAKYETGCDRLIFDKAAFAEPFFILSSGLAGEILQKFVNYRLKVAIVGDYSHYTSKPLHDFIRESNRGRDVFFISTIEDAVELLAKA
jgi:hypothetical protein